MRGSAIRTVDGCRTDGWGASRCYLRGLEHFLAVICRTDGSDGWKGDVNIDAGDGFSYRLNHMRAAANGEDEQYLVLARPRPNIGHVYLPISSSFTSLPQPTNPLPSASPANRPPRPSQAVLQLDDSPPTTQDQGRYHYHNKSPRPSHFQPSCLITEPGAQSPKTHHIHKRPRHNASDQ